MISTSENSLRIGDFAPECILPGGARLSELRGQPVILAFAPDEWNPVAAYQSEVFARLSHDFAGGAAFVDVSADASADDWHALDAGGTLAAKFGVEGQRALLLLDESGVLK